MKKKKIEVVPDYLYLVTQQLAIGFSPTEIIFSTASSFIYSCGEKNYLITNWHNVSGRNPINGEPLSSTHSGLPDVFLTHLRLKDENGKSEIQRIYLYEDDEMTKPRWLVHPTYKEKVDVVAIELEDNKIYLSSN